MAATSDLREIRYFRDLDDEEVRRVAAVARTKRYERGEILLLEGMQGGALCYVKSGLIKIYKTSPDAKEQVLRLIGPGQTFNDVPALDGGPNPASAAALEPSEVLMLSGEALRQLIAERPAVATAVVAALARALRHMVGLVEDLSFRHVTERVAKLLLEQQERLGGAGGGHRLTQQEMAAMTGTAREMVGRALKELEDSGAISIERGHITVRAPERLRLLAGL